MLELVKRPNSPYWIARGTINGRRIERSTRCRSKHDARQALAQIIAEATADRIGEEGLRFDQALAMYIDAHPNARFIGPLAKFFKGMPVKDINLTEMRRAANQLYPGAAPSTIQRQLYTPMKAILNHAADEELCPRPQFRSLQGIGKKRTVFFMPDQADALIDSLMTHPHKHYAVLVTFLFGQGSRMGETLNLEWEDVSMENRFAILRNTKSGEERRLSLIGRTVAALSTIRPDKPKGPVFLRSDGNPFVTGKAAGGQIKSQWAKAAKAAGVSASTHTPHVCRHSWATWYYAQTKDVLSLKAEGGWSSEEYQRYTKLATEELGESARKHGWIFKKLGESRGNKERTA